MIRLVAYRKSAQHVETLNKQGIAWSVSRRAFRLRSRPAQNSYDLPRSARPTTPSVQRRRKPKQHLSLKLFARSTALLVMVAVLLALTGGHSRLTWAIGVVTLLLAILVYVVAVRFESDLYALQAGTKKKASVYVIPTKKGS